MKIVFLFIVALMPLAGADVAYATVTTPNCDQIEAYGRSASPASDDVLKDFFGQPLADISSNDISTLQQAALDCSEDESDNESNAPNLDLAIRKLEALRPIVQLFEDQKAPSASTADTDPSCAALAPPSDSDIADTQFQQMSRAEESGKALANIYGSGILDLYYSRKKREKCAGFSSGAPKDKSAQPANQGAQKCSRFSAYGGSQYDSDHVLKLFFGVTVVELSDNDVLTLKSAAEDCVRANSSTVESTRLFRQAVSNFEKLRQRREQISEQNREIAAAANNIAQLAKEVELLPHDTTSLHRLSEIEKEADRIAGQISMGSKNDDLLAAEYKKVHTAVQSKIHIIQSKASNEALDTPNNAAIEQEGSEATQPPSSTEISKAGDCSLEIQQEQLPNEQGIVFNILHLVSHCETEIELYSIKLNRRDECVIRPTQTLRLGDDYSFGLATNSTEALGMAMRKSLIGQEFFDVAMCGQPVKLDVSTSAGPFEFSSGE